jgi:hypothetical protein
MKGYFAIFLFFAVLLSACSEDIDPKEHVAEIYRTAFDSIMENDKALNSNAKFIAVDMKNLTDLNERDKQEILNYFKDKYQTEAMNATFEELKENGMYNPETASLDGVLLKIEQVDFVNNHEVMLEGSKYKSGLGAFDCKLIVHFEEEKWQVKEFKTTSES